MKPDNETNETDERKAPKQVPAKPVQLACTVLETGTRIGRLTVGKGHKCKLQKDQAEALASLNPPRVRIDGV